MERNRIIIFLILIVLIFSIFNVIRLNKKADKTGKNVEQSINQDLEEKEILRTENGFKLIYNKTQNYYEIKKDEETLSTNSSKEQMEELMNFYIENPNFVNEN